MHWSLHTIFAGQHLLQAPASRSPNYTLASSPCTVSSVAIATIRSAVSGEATVSSVSTVRSGGGAAGSKSVGDSVWTSRLSKSDRPMHPPKSPKVAAKQSLTPKHSYGISSMVCAWQEECPPPSTHSLGVSRSTKRRNSLWSIDFVRYIKSRGACPSTRPHPSFLPFPRDIVPMASHFFNGDCCSGRRAFGTALSHMN